MIQLIAAEAHKAVRRPFDVVLTLVVVGLSILGPVIVMVRAFREPERAASHVVQLTWPLSLDRASFVLLLIGVLGAAMLAASAVGNEHDARTWATLVSRRASRYPLLLAKVVVVFATVAAVSLLAVAAAAVTSWIAAAIVGVAPDPAVLARQPRTSLALTIAFAIADGWWSALWAIAAAVLLRSTLAAALLGILMPRLWIAVLSEETAFFNPAIHFMNLRHAAGLLRIPPLYDVGVGVWGSGAVILLYSVALIAAIAYWFEKRDVLVS